MTASVSCSRDEGQEEMDKFVVSVVHGVAAEMPLPVFDTILHRVETVAALKYLII